MLFIIGCGAGKVFVIKFQLVVPREYYRIGKINCTGDAAGESGVRSGKSANGEQSDGPGTEVLHRATAYNNGTAVGYSGMVYRAGSRACRRHLAVLSARSCGSAGDGLAEGRRRRGGGLVAM